MIIRIIGLLFISSLFSACNGSKQEKEVSENVVVEQSGTSAKLEKGNIRHTVMFNLKYGVDAPETDKFLQDGQRILSALPMVKNFEVSRQVSSKNEYKFYFSMVFDNQEAYKAYNDHPEHVKFVKERWETEVTNFLEADFVAVE
ncbi:Dabb family protein [Dysgonomonas sp. GY75]|uniref:Dabb family protein n=1 Tax=Dysgonomonas sp. GY75 TaxID=2780419 RepID=UPI001883D267|nr:Dabb family protein [Dysgonomonas sp. GY75]MBF0650615.1 Dabb family protein [Dysgonomonas sp. GY75]